MQHSISDKEINGIDKISGKVRNEISDGKYDYKDPKSIHFMIKNSLNPTKLFERKSLRSVVEIKTPLDTLDINYNNSYNKDIHQTLLDRYNGTGEYLSQIEFVEMIQELQKMLRL